MDSPESWSAGLGSNGTAGWGSHRATVRILPGESMNGFIIQSYGLPRIRKIRIDPRYENFPEAGEGGEIQQFDETTEAIAFKGETLGPSAVFPGSFDHWNQLRDDLNQAIQLGWITDAALASTLVTQLASARQAVDDGDGTLAKTRLQTVLDTLAPSTAPQRRLEVADLISLNVQALIDNTASTVFPFEPQASFSPVDVKHPIGTPYVVTATMINLGDNQPIEGFFVTLKVEEGPHAGEQFEGITDAEGKIRLSYTGRNLGEDKIRLVQEGEVITDFGGTSVTWEGGPDLAVPFFVPPVLKGEANGTVIVTEKTINLGNTPSGPSITRYYFSETEPVDPTTALVLGERSVPSLQPGEEQGEASPLALTLPSNLLPGVYFMAACADGPNTLAELNEENNCSFNDVIGKTIVVPMELSSQDPITDLFARAKDSKINIVWNPISGAIHYNIFRKEGTQGFVLIKSEHVTDYATYADFGLTNGVTYSYRVRWVDDQGHASADSNVASATPTARRRR